MSILINLIFGVLLIGFTISCLVKIISWIKDDLDKLMK